MAVLRMELELWDRRVRIVKELLDVLNIYLRKLKECFYWEYYLDSHEFAYSRPLIYNYVIIMA